jgi:hypothetical protein
MTDADVTFTLDGENRSVPPGKRTVSGLLAELGIDSQSFRLQRTSKAGRTTESIDDAETIELRGGEVFRLVERRKYRPSPKHKPVPSRGVKGAICPPGVDAQKLLDESVTHPSRPHKRYATDGTHCYAAHPDGTGGWHGWPCPRVQVPEQIWRIWLKEGKLSRR